MSDSTASSRALSGAEEFDRRIRSIGQTPSDALAELARLVGQQDPFRPGAGVIPSQPARPKAPALSPLALEEAYHQVSNTGEEPGAPAEPAVVHAVLPEPQAWERVVPRFPSISPREHPLIEPTPDLWARGVEDEPDEGIDAPALIATREKAVAEPASAGRTLVVLAAVIVLTGGGLAASFLAKPSASPASASETPTILAAIGPSKVQPETPPAGEDASSEPSKLLDKNKNDGTAEAKVVNAIEQPVDLAQAIKPAAVEAPDVPAASPSPFPEPRKVKTILVRPDGTIIADTAPASAAVPVTAASQEASLAFDTRTALPPVTRDQPPVAIPPSPHEPAVAMAEPASVEAASPPVGKTTARVTPVKPAASTAPEGSAAAQARTSVATPKTKPVAHLSPKPKPKPVEAAAAPVVVADAGPAAEATAATEPATEPTSGSFAIQLGAALSEAEGQAAAAKLGQRYADAFGGVKPSIYKAQSGGKTVYRIRVGNLSQESAKALCGKVQAGGGGCFVAR